MYSQSMFNNIGNAFLSLNFFVSFFVRQMVLLLIKKVWEIKKQSQSCLNDFLFFSAIEGSKN